MEINSIDYYYYTCICFPKQVEAEGASNGTQAGFHSWGGGGGGPAP